MVDLIGGLFVAATLALVPFFGLLAAITIAAWLGRGRRSVEAIGPGTSPARFLVVIPAHDEQGAIGATVRSCLALDYPPDRFTVYVIADNCTDQTAVEAREAGALVVERINPDLRSKGHALEYFFSRIPEGRPDAGHDATVLIDADTVVDPALLITFDRALAEGIDWIQGYYTVRNPDASWRTRLMTYAFSLANGAWMLGLDRLGLGVGLKGNGMCFSSAGLKRVAWQAHGLVEDMEFALMLRARGERVRFEPRARVFGEMVSKGGTGAASQRRRWEAGRRSLRGKFAPQLARSRALRPLAKLAYLIDLYFPPLATLALGLGLVFGIQGLQRFDPRFRPIALGLLGPQLLMAGFLVCYAISPFVLMGLPVRYLASLLALPYYVAWKLVVSVGKGPKQWIRTPREAREP